MNTHTSRRRIAPALIALLTTLLMLLAVASAASALTQGRYVALGDSYSAGPLIGAPTAEDAPLGCIQAINNYPHLIRPLTGLRDFTDVSCSGAETEDMLGSQGVTPGPAKPQFNALTADTRLVTLTIGGNDIGFSSIASDCLNASPFGHPCFDKFVKNGVDTLAQRIAATGPSVGAVLRGIRERSPKAKVFIAGYPDIMPDNGVGCWPILPVSNTDLKYLISVEKGLNAMIKAQAEANGAIYVDTYTPSIGHDACKGPASRWIEAVIPTLPGAPLHPNTAGHVALASIIWKAIYANS
ncbi:MAG: SGNH/GDSL hydrolase family protein [Solirubrobacterales bacterium]